MGTGRVYNRVTAADWASLGGDRFQTGPPLVLVSTRVNFEDGRLVVRFNEVAPDINGGLPCIPIGENALDVTLRRPSDGAQLAPGGLGLWKEWGNYENQTDAHRAAYWTPSEGVLSQWIQDGYNKWVSGYLAEAIIGPPPENDPTFLFEIHVPFSWFGVDVGTLLFAFTCFHSPGGTLARTFLDREAILQYAAGAGSYFRRRRLFTYRVVDEPRIDHIKRLAIESGALIRWGGFQNENDTTQQWGLGILDWDTLREITTVYDASPAGDAGRDMFLATPITVRHTDQYILNKATTVWGGGVIESGPSANRLRGAEFPFDTREPGSGEWVGQYQAAGNRIQDKDEASIATYGERPIEVSAPSILDRSSADGLALTRWTDPRRVVEFGMGPLHWDFDVGDIIHVRHPDIGLEGTEALLVTAKTIQWRTLHAVISTLQVNLDPAPMEPTDPELGDVCQLWLKAGTGLNVNGMTSEVTGWGDQSGHARDVSVPAGMVAPTLTSVEDGVGGEPAVQFGTGAARGLGVDGLFETDSDYRRFWTVVAVVKITESDPIPDGVILSSLWDSGLKLWGTGTYGEEIALRTRLSTALSIWNGTEDTDPVVGEWFVHISTVDWQPGGLLDAGANLEISNGVENNGGTVPNVFSIHGFGDTFETDHANYGIGFDRYNNAAPWPGPIAEVQVYSVPLRPQHLRRILADIRTRLPGAGL